VTLKRVVTKSSVKQSVAMAGSDLATVLVFPVPHSDVGLVRALRAGQPDALSVLNERYGTEMLRIGMRVLGPDENLNEVVIAGFRGAIASIDQLEEPRELRRWLLTHLIFAVRRHLRSKKRWAFGTMIRRFLFPHLDVFCEAGYSERLIRTYRFLDRLEVNERIALSLAVIGEMEPTEISTILETSLVRVQKWYHRGWSRFERISEE
jgi:DNA-directed RNA polymerase specialized sigma24 family protein